MTPISTDKRKKKRTKATVMTFAINILSILVVAGITWYGVSQNTAGANSQKLITLESDVIELKADCKVQKEKNSDYKEDEGKILNQINNKLDTVLDFQVKQSKFNQRIVEGNEKLNRSLNDIFNIKRIVNY